MPVDRQWALAGKIETLRRMIAFARSVPDAWGQHEMLANTEKGLGVHALNLDLDVGPLLQTQKLLDSVVFARRKGCCAHAERGRAGNDESHRRRQRLRHGDDAAAVARQVPTANFFQPSGYADNPVAQRNNVVARLIAATNARMDEESKKPGARGIGRNAALKSGPPRGGVPVWQLGHCDAMVGRYDSAS